MLCIPPIILFPPSPTHSFCLKSEKKKGKKGRKKENGTSMEKYYSHDREK